jgi:DNA-directed RNA polymerase specialized sigma subunit
LYADLVQEGLTALLDAMSHYRQDQQQQEQNVNDNNTNDNNNDDNFEVYAKQQIQDHLQQIMRQEKMNRLTTTSSTRSTTSTRTTNTIRLPKSIQRVLRQAQQISKQLEEEQGKKPSIATVAQYMKIPVEQLQDYLHVAKRQQQRIQRKTATTASGGSTTGTSLPPLSMESTVEVISPSSTTDETTTYVDQDTWEETQNMLLNDGRTIHKNEIIQEYLDENLEFEGDDQAWIHQEQIAGPLQELIPDVNEPSPDDTVLLEVIQQDMSEFLNSTLTETEVQVVRMVFGLDTGRQQSIKRTAQALQLTPEETSILLAGSLDKLRSSYTNRYVEPWSYLDDNDMVDSV